MQLLRPTCHIGTRETRQRSWIDRVYLSRDPSLDKGDVYLANVERIGSLATGAAYTGHATVTLPEGIEGSYYLLLAADDGNGVPEFADEGNNLAVRPLTVSLHEPPDLRVTTVSIPEHAMVGQSFSLGYTVSNVSTGATPPLEGTWTDEFYLSRDPFLDYSADRYLGSRAHSGGLASAASYSETVALTLPGDLVGAYYVFVATDPARGSTRGSVFELAHETDNATAGAQPLLIELQPPSDLQVDSIVTGGSVKSGGPLHVSWTVSNHGAEPAAGSWTDAVYLSTDAVWDIGDRLLGRVDHNGTLTSTQAYTSSLEARVPPLAEGQYRVIVRTDIYNQVFEGAEEANNRAASPDPLTVSVEELHLGVALNTTLDTGQTRVFRIAVGPDETLRVRLTSPAVDGANEVFLRYGDIPTAVTFDAIYQDPLQADQIAVIPNTKAGTYYVLVRGHQEPAPGTPVRLLAEVVPLAIAGIKQDRGGDSGHVTVTITGARFAPGAVVKLVRPDIAEIEPVRVQVVDSTKIVALFDFSDVPHGQYDLEVINPNGQRVIEPYRYLVERAIEPDVAIGLGGPRVVLAGDIGTYGVAFQSLTNIDTPYVKYEFGIPEMGFNPILFGLPYVALETNLRGAPDGGSKDIPWASLDSEVNSGGRLLAPGYLMDFGAGDFTGLTFNVLTYPGLKEMWEREYPALKETMKSVFPNLDHLLEDDGRGLDEWWNGLRSEVIAKFPEAEEGLMKFDLPAMIKGALQFPSECQRPELFAPFRFHVAAAATAMTREEFVNEQTGEAMKLRDAILADAKAAPALQVLAANPDVWVASYLAALEAGGLLRPVADVPPLREDAKALSLQSVLATGILLGPAGDQYTTTTNLVDFFEQLHVWYGDAPGTLAPVAGWDSREWISLMCGDVELDVPIPKLPTLADVDAHLSQPTHLQALNVFVPWIPFEKRSTGMALPAFGSIASNLAGEGTGFFDLDKAGTELSAVDFSKAFERAATAGVSATISGPESFGAAQFLPNGQALPYEISFENPPTASAIPGSIEVISRLDAQLDARTFRLGDIKIGDIQVHIPEGRATFQGDFDFTRSKGFILRVTAGVDVERSIASWLFEAIDPLTGEVIRDTTKGLLAPNNALGIGQGSVGYTILPRTDALTGDAIAANARVLFNTAAPQDAPQITQTLDAVVPKTTLTAERIGAACNDYQLRWTSVDDDGGSGVRHATVYVAEDGGDFKILLRQTSETAAIYAGREGHSYEFLAMATDNAGNREQPPPGALAPDDGSHANLGSLPTFETTPADPPPPPAELPATNPLFVEAAKAVPSTATSSRPSEFRTVLSPFAAEAFATGIRQSFADIGTLAIVRLPDGSFLASGGSNRGELYRLSADGGVAGSPLIRLDVPIFDLALDANGRLWATTGGGALLELDPASGAILAEHGDGITQALAIHPESGKIYVSTGGGVAIFDPATGIFEPFSETRVDDLAFSPTGELWGTSWPERGTLVQFSPLGRGQAVVRLDAKVDSLAFGRPGSALAGLLFVTTNDGELEMIDLATFQHLSIAQGGSRGENVMATADGALLVAQSHQIDRIAPRFAPRVVGTNPPHLGAAALPLASLTVTFDQDMAADDPSQTGSVLNLANYTLTGTTSGAVAIRSASYDAAARSVTLHFDPLAPDSFALHVAGALASRLGATLGTAYNASFTTTVDLSSHVRIDFLNTRSSRADGTVSYDVRVTNIGDGDLLTPIVLALDPARYFQGQPVNADGPNALGLWLIKLEEALADGALHPGESTLAHTVTVSDPLWQRVEIGHGVYAVPAPNAPPAFESTPLTAARAGEAYAYTALASDPGGGPVSYLLQSGPQGMAVDVLTGAVAWTPTFASPEQANVVLRAYDRSGAYASQSFTIALAGVNHAPQILDLPARIEIDEGQLFEMPLVAADADGDRLTFFADNLPGGAVINAERQTLAWTPGFAAAGDYRGITLTVSDGLAVDRVSFDLTVRPVDQAPTLLTPPERTVREGDPIRIQLAASDPEGAPLYYSSRFLPGGSFLDPHTGEFEWTPGFTQAGTYHIPFSVGDGTSATSVTATITVLNVNGLPEFDRLGEWQVREGQTLFFRAFAFDPENPSFVPQDRLPDGLLTPLLESEPTVTYTAIGLPVGATFDTETAMFVWTPGFMQAGTYTASFTASDDGDGTGASGISTLSVPITVLNANQAPDVPEMANRTLNRDEVVEVPVVVTDADGNALTLSAAGLPAFATFTDNGGGRGVFRFAPGATDRGDHVLTVTATDDGDGGGATAALSSTRSFVVSVSVPNEAPQLAWIGDKVAVAGETLSFNVRATDVEENPLTFSFDTLPAGATLTPQDVYGTALFTWTPTAADLGAHALTLRIADDGNAGLGPVGTDAQTLRVVVRSANQAPVLQPVGDHTLSEGDTLVLPVLAVDPDGDPLTFSATNLPAGASLDPETGVLRWTPNLIQAGDYDGIVLSVSDGHRSDSETIALQVVNRNQAPVLTPLADQSTRETAELSFTLVANDFDGDPIAYASLNPLPAGARFDGRSATFTWTPNYDQAGEYRLSFLAQDPDGARDTVDVTVRVDNLDRAPTLAVEKHQARIGETFRLALTASDPDRSTTLVYRAKGLPDGATLDPATGVIEWTPGVGQAGDSLVLVTVSDGELSTTEPLVLRASLAPAAPTVTIEQTPSFAAVPGQPVVVHVLASSFAPIATRILTVNGLPVALDSTGTARLKAGAPGRLELVATATDADGLTSTTTSTLRVRDPLDSAAPVAVLDSALHSARLSAPTELRATVADSNLDEWRLELLPFSPEPSASTLAPLGERGQGWGGSILATGNGSVTNDVLTTLDTGKFANGIYKLRLMASDMAGRVSSSEALIEIAGAAKPGQFVRRETDLAVTLDGIALDLVREYDSLATSNAGSFGPGWRLALRDLDLQTDVPATGREASGVANPFSLGTRVYLTLPTGERVGFTFTPEKYELPGVIYYTPAFTADAGVTWTLNAIDSKLSLAGNRLFDLGTGLPYNPALAAGGEAQLVLTAPDGTAYHLDAAHGVTAIVSTNGKRLVVSDSGIVAANGESVRFVSNAEGQLASISGPGGERIVYGYDGEGRLSSVRRIADSESTHYGYEVGPAGRLSIVTGAHDLAIDYSAATPVAVALAGDLGAARSYLATPFAGDLAAGAVDRLDFAVRPSEFASTASGSIYLGVVVEASDGSTLLPGTPVIEGLTAIASSAAGGRSFALYALTQEAGARVGDVLHLLRIAGMDAATAGAYSVQVFVAGDANGDTKVDGSDAAIVAGARGKRAGDTGYVAAADANRDGVIDGVDSGLVFQNLGYAPNRPPVVTPLLVKTHVDLAVSIAVSEFSVDAEGDPTYFTIVGAINGMASSLGDGRSVLFTPKVSHAGSATLQVTAMDDYADAVTATIDIDVSDAELVRLNFTRRGIRLQPGESERIDLVGDFEDQTNIALPAGYIHIESTDPESGSVSLDGVFHGLAIGTGAVVASRGSLEAATAFAVGVPQESADFLRYAIGLSLYPQSISIPISSGERELIVTGGDGANVTGADTGTRYFVSDKRVVSVSPDGLVRPLGVGQATVTIVNGGSEVSAPINVGVPALASVVMDKNGAIVKTATGTIAAFAPSALAEGQPVSISSVAIGSLPIEAPDSLHALGAFELEFSAAEASVPIQITAPVAADIPAGTKVYFLRQATVRTADGSEIQAWIQEDTGVVGSDGLARTSSPPHRGVVARGLYLIASATDAMGYIRGQIQASAAATITALVHTGNAWIGSVVTGSAYALDLLPGTYTVVAFLTTALGLTTSTSGTLQVNAGRTTHSTLVPPSLPTLPGAPADPPQIRGVVLDIPSSGDPELVISGDRFTFANALAPADRRDGSQIEDAVVRFRDPGGRLVGEAIALSSSSAVEIRVHVPVGVVVGQASVSVVRPQWELTSTGWDRRVERVSNPFHLNADARYIFAPLGGDGLVAAINGQTGELAARISVGGGQERPGPRAAVLTSDNTRAYVSLRFASGVSVIDTTSLHEVDVDQETDGTQFIQIPGAHPYWAVVDKEDHYLYVSDEELPIVYVIDIRPSSAEYHQVGTIPIHLPGQLIGSRGLRGMGLSSDGAFLYVAASNGPRLDGHIAVVDLRPPIKELRDITARSVVDAIEVGKEPFGITASENPNLVLFTDKFDDRKGVGTVRLNRDTSRLQAPTYVDLTLGRAGDRFDVNNAVAVTLTADARYAFVTGFNEYRRLAPSYDPLFDIFGPVDRPVGGNIGIIRDPLGLDTSHGGPELVAATEGIPLSFPDNSVLSGDGKKLFVGFRAAGKVVTYDVKSIRTILDQAFGSPTSSPTRPGLVEMLRSTPIDQV